MKFHDYDSAFTVATGSRANLGYGDFYSKHLSLAQDALRTAEKGSPKYRHARNSSLFLRFEREWWEARRPYYKVWPSIAQSLLRLNLGCYARDLALEPLWPTAIRFPVGEEMIVGTYALKTLLVLVTSSTKLDQSPAVLAVMAQSEPPWTNDESRKFLVIVPIRYPNENSDLTIFQWLERFTRSLECSQLRRDATKLALSIALLAHDPSVIQPDVLADDRARFDRSTDPEERQRLIDKAAKRGIVGWRIGEEYEVCPHYRRPHFALRHTGKGGTIPRIVPVKGAIVHRQRVTDVPTGYIDDEGREHEPYPKSMEAKSCPRN